MEFVHIFVISWKFLENSLHRDMCEGLKVYMTHCKYIHWERTVLTEAGDVLLLFQGLCKPFRRKPAVIWLTQFCLLSWDHSAQEYHISLLRNLLKKDLGLETALCLTYCVYKRGIFGLSGWIMQGNQEGKGRSTSSTGELKRQITSRKREQQQQQSVKMS